MNEVEEPPISADEASIRSKLAITDRLTPDTPCKPARMCLYEKYLRAGKPWRAAAILYKRPICGARRKVGLLCLSSPVRPGGRCDRHGGASTGPRTQAGVQRIREGQYRRRERERAAAAAEAAKAAAAAASAAGTSGPGVSARAVGRFVKNNKQGRNVCAGCAGAEPAFVKNNKAG